MEKLRKNWQRVKLGNVVNFVSDKIEVEKINRDNYISTENLLQNKSGVVSATSLPDVSRVNHFLEKDILFSNIRTYFKKVWFSRFEGGASNDVIIFRTKDSDILDSKFLYYTISGDDFINTTVVSSKGTKMPRGDKDAMIDFEFYLPKKELQKQIVDIFSTYDDLIENNNRRIEILEEMAQSIYKEWFIDFRFPGHEKVKFVDSGTEFGKIPEGWEVKKILNVPYFEICNKKIDSFEGEKEYLPTANINGINIVKSGEFVTYKNKPGRAQLKPLMNSVWFARMKDTYKILAYREINKDMADNQILSSGMVGFSSSNPYFGFLYLMIRSDLFHSLKDRNATGSTQVSLTNQGLEGVKLLTPEEKVVVRFGSKVNNLIDEIILLQKINRNLEQSRDLLLPKLISGEIEL